ncbi:hypothetical protein CONPUDRAFT_142252 [Coniophora puteana RWD-64-598 SS2]|uniref:Uncharacterized protein n=1 Tax=Coniophora puteana (strain RWD-64-598) TaxID=741705 RepID=A0A5M3MY76_CONPW|nr:uncharacterized protein CONPUDRAFT_142252 [Coniophora puteana RWD-64-598 SS2]EIW83581.1 hypothetical protein CONPUDRAFT_142252 [Coniophora puteana RWD-64-598 SS2]
MEFSQSSIHATSIVSMAFNYALVWDITHPGTAHQLTQELCKSSTISLNECANELCLRDIRSKCYLVSIKSNGNRCDKYMQRQFSRVYLNVKSVTNYFKSPNRTWSGAQLVKVLGRDCLIFYLWNALASVTQTAARANWPANYNQIGATWMFAVQPMIINHLVIHMNVQLTRGGLSWNED